MPKSFDEIINSHEICEYCDYEHGGFCDGSHCDEAYQNYLDEIEDEYDGCTY